MTGNNRHGFVLQDPDKQLLRELGIMRVLDREQASVLPGSDRQGE
jgi:hypothetical protein